MAYLRFLRDNSQWLGAGFLLIFMSGIAQTSFVAIFTGALRAEFGLSHGQWGGIYSLATAASAALMLLAGGIADRVGTRWLSTAVLLGLGLVCFAFSYAQGLVVLGLTVFVLRFVGMGMTAHVAMVSTARWFTRARGRALAVVMSGFALSEAILPVVFVAALETTDWRVLWRILGVMVLAGAFVMPLILRGERIPAGDEVTGEQTGMFGQFWTRGQAMRHWLFWLLAPSMVLMPALMSAFFFHQVHYAEVAGVEHIALVALFPPFTIVLTACVFAWGWAVDKWGTGPLYPWSLLPAAVGFLFFATAGSIPAIAVGMIGLGISFSAQETLRATFLTEYYGSRHLGSIKAVAIAMHVLGTAIGPGLTGVLIDLGIGIRVQFGCAVVLVLMASAAIQIGLGRARRLLTVAA